MKYFMHKSNASSKETISELKSIYGAEGYAVYFIILEKIASGIGEGKNSWNHSSARYSVADWASFCLVSKKKFRKILEFLEKKEKFFLKSEIISGVEMLTIDCPNILKHRDQYAFRRAREEGEKVRTLSVQKPDVSISLSRSSSSNYKENNSTSERMEIAEVTQKQISDVFMHWVEIHAGNNTSGYPVLDETRGTAIEKMLKQGYSVDSLKLAIEGCALSPFHRGENKTGDIHNAISLIFKNSDQVEKFIDIAKKHYPKINKYDEFLKESNDEYSRRFAEILKRAESENRYDLTLAEIKMYHRHLKIFCLRAISGAFEDFQLHRTQYQGKFPKVSFLREYASQREKSLRTDSLSNWEEILRWIAKGWSLADLPQKTRAYSIINNEMYRKQLPEKLEDFEHDDHAKEKFIELFLNIEEGK